MLQWWHPVFGMSYPSWNCPWYSLSSRQHLFTCLWPAWLMLRFYHSQPCPQTFPKQMCVKSTWVFIWPSVNLLALSMTSFNSCRPTCAVEKQLLCDSTELPFVSRGFHTLLTWNQQHTCTANWYSFILILESLQ